MAIFRNKEGDLPPLIPTAASESMEAAPTTKQKPTVAGPAGLPELPQIPPQAAAQESPVAAPPEPAPAKMPDLQPPDLEPMKPQPAPAPAEVRPQPAPQMPELSPVVPTAPLEAAPQPQPIQAQPEKAPEPAPQSEPTLQPAPEAGPQFDQQVEQVKRPESADDMQQEQPRKQEDEGKLRKRRRKKQQDDDQQTPAAQQPTAQVPEAKTPERMEIEKILSDGMSELYQTMTPQQQEAFRLKGDETATAIEQMVHNLKASTRKVVSLIRDWLQLIPGVNKYFLEQESKLKTDEIVKYQRKVKKERKSRVTL